jgi:hypothetical protein
MEIEMRRLSYFTTFTVYLSSEDYHNAGLTRDEIKDIIESTRLDNHRLRVQNSGFNGNWNFEMPHWANESDAEMVVTGLRLELERALESKRKLSI